MTSAEQTVEITQVSLLKDEKFAKFVAPTVATSLEEVRQFFETAADCFEVPVGDGGFSVLVEPKFTFRDLSTDGDAFASVWKQAQLGKLYDHQIVGELVKMNAELTGTAVIVTDVEIAPPPDWRYIIWDTFPEGVVVSLAPLDPWYWGDRTPPDLRLGTIKSRVRAANLSIIGQLLGLARCDNDECFLFTEVDSVTRLDGMSYLGPEHGVKELSNRGFEPWSSSPEEQQKVVRHVSETA